MDTYAQTHTRIQTFTDRSNSKKPGTHLVQKNRKGYVLLHIGEHLVISELNERQDIQAAQFCDLNRYYTFVQGTLVHMACQQANPFIQW